MAAAEMQVEITKENTKLRVLICDDDPGSLRLIHEKAVAIFHRLTVNARFDLFTTASNISEEHLKNCHIALLDIDLAADRYSGIDIARALRKVNSRALIIFITNFIEYAPEGYEVQAFRYILKRDVDEVLGRYIMQALEQLSETRQTLRLQSKGEHIELPFENITYLEVLQHNVSVHVMDEKGGQVYTVNATLSSFEQQLEKYGFLRIHKSYLVNMRHIRKFQCRELTLDDGTVLRTSEKSYAEQKRKYLLWKGWQ